MPPSMRPAVLFLAALGLTATACGAEIGDSCTLSSDCSTDGTRICDPDPNSTGGYCTIQGCDYGTCPSEAECVRFFTGVFSNKTCTPATEDCIVRTCPLDGGKVVASSSCSVGTCPHNDDYTSETPPTDQCNADELCALDGHCVTRASEVRYCMRKCSKAGATDNRDPAGDCRDGYECRGLDLMVKDGGEPVPAPGTRLDDNPQGFCAQKGQ